MTKLIYSMIETFLVVLELCKRRNLDDYSCVKEETQSEHT